MTWLAIICQYDRSDDDGYILPVRKFETEELAKEYIDETIDEANAEIQENLEEENENDEDYSEYIESRYYYITKVVEL